MAFIADKEELKPGLVIFRRTDVRHRNWYCRVKVPKADRYKTVSLKTSDINTARQNAWRQDMEVQICLERDIPVFNRPFSQVAKEYLATQEERAQRHEISPLRVKKIKSLIEGVLDEYVGTTQVHRIGQDSWDGYPAWRRQNGAGRNARNGTRDVTAELAKKLAEKDAAARDKARAARKLRPKVRNDKNAQAAPATEDIPFISDSTIKFEMSIFGAVMNYAIKKRYAPVTQRFEDRPKLKVMRRDEFTPEEYRALYKYALNTWLKAAKKPASKWYRKVAYNFVLIMCNTGMRPSEAKNLRWRDITPSQDKDKRPIVVLFVQGKGKSRQLVAPASVGQYLERIRQVSAAAKPDDRVFTTSNGKPANSLYKALVEDLLDKAGLRNGPHGVPRSTYSFRHTYATYRLSLGVDVYFLAEQMGTSVKMIQDHYGHVNTIQHADRVLQGIGGWDPVEEPAETSEEDAKAAKAVAAKQPPASGKRKRPRKS
jgi:integrase